MSEYIEFEAVPTADPNVMIIATNLQLAEGEDEQYDSPAAMETGSALAQMLSSITGIEAMQIHGRELVVRNDGETPWHLIVAEISAIVREFVL
jgi:hypothetical protein